MCCFAGHVSDVSGTNIFARVGGDREYLVYEMTFTSDDETAMILPIPTVPGDAEAVQFVALDDYPEFFRDLEVHFEQLRRKVEKFMSGSPARLKVQRVGAFEASFVPSMDQFRRLDTRFRIPEQAWQQLPGYASFGFVVFKLRPGRRVGVHPMAFSFRTRDVKTVFFPTVHVHDGMVHEQSSFDHFFYTQNKPTRVPEWPTVWWMSGGEPASRYLRVGRTHGLVDGNAPCFHASLVGPWRNSDVLVPI